MQSLKQIQSHSSIKKSTFFKKIHELAKNAKEILVLQYISKFQLDVGFFGMQSTLSFQTKIPERTLRRILASLKADDRKILIAEQQGIYRTTIWRLNPFIFSPEVADDVAKVAINVAKMTGDPAKVADNIMNSININLNTDDRADAREDSSSSKKEELKEQNPKPTQKQVLLVERIRRRLPKKDWHQNLPRFPNEWIMATHLKTEFIESVLDFVEKKGEVFNESILNSQSHFENLMERIDMRKNEPKEAAHRVVIDEPVSTPQKDENIEPESNKERIIPKWLSDLAAKAEPKENKTKQEFEHMRERILNV